MEIIDQAARYAEWVKGEFTCPGCGRLLSNHLMCCGGTKGGSCRSCCPEHNTGT